MSYQCLTCGRDAGYRYQCHRCTDNARRWLREIEDYAAVIVSDMDPDRGPMVGSIGAAFGSRPPLSVEKATLLDFRSGGGAAVWRLRDPRDMDDEPIRSLPGSVHGIACWIREERGEDEPREWTLVSELRYLRGQIEGCALEQWVDELHEDIGELHRQARRLAHDVPPGELGHCLTVTCDGLVYPALVRDSQGEHDGGRCSGCERTYTGLDLVRLGVAEEAS